MDSKKKKELELWAARIRKTALQTIRTAGSGHIGGSFSLGEILAVLYFDQMNVDPANPKKADQGQTGAFQRTLLTGFVRSIGAEGIFSAGASVHIPKG